MINGIHRGHHAEEHLGGADVRCGFIAADVLLASSECEAHGRVALSIFGNANETTGHLAFVDIFGREETRMRSAESHGHAESLGRTHGDIGTEFPRGAQESKREQVGGDDGERVGFVNLGEERFVVVNTPGRIGILHEHAEEFSVDVFETEREVIANDDTDPERLGAGFNDIDGLRMAFLGNEKHPGIWPRAYLHPVTHHHRFGGGGAFIEHGGVGDLESGEVGDDGLKIEEGFETSLGNLGLVGRVSRIPAGVFEDVALDDAGHGGVVITHADEAAESLILLGNLLELGEGSCFAGGRGEVERSVEADLRGHCGISEGIERIITNRLEHRRDVRVWRAVMAAFKGVSGSEEFALRCHSHDHRRSRFGSNRDLVEGGQFASISQDYF